MSTPWGLLLFCGWPGLAGLWFRGQLSSLVLAIGFSILFNLALVTSFLWPWSLGETFPAVAWPLILLIWSVSAIIGFQRLPDYMAIPTSEKVADQRPSDTLFIQAQGEYLRGHWEEAAGLLRRQLHRSPRDIESRLLLATLSRHTRDFDGARFELGEIEKFDEAAEWKFEIDRERELLEIVWQHEHESVLSGTTDDSVDRQHVEPIDPGPDAGPANPNSGDVDPWREAG